MYRPYAMDHTIWSILYGPYMKILSIMAGCINVLTNLPKFIGGKN